MEKGSDEVVLQHLFIGSSKLANFFREEWLILITYKVNEGYILH